MKKGEDFTGVTIVYFCHDGKGNFLFNKRSKNCRDEIGNWDCGGGALEFGETVEETLKKEVKEEIFAKHGGKAENTGSAEGQIALFTHRITHLTEHLKKNRHDYNTERSLVLLVGKRRALLDYLKKKEINRYREIIKVLNIRK